MLTVPTIAELGTYINRKLINDDTDTPLVNTLNITVQGLKIPKVFNQARFIGYLYTHEHKMYYINETETRAVIAGTVSDKNSTAYTSLADYMVKRSSSNHADVAEVHENSLLTTLVFTNQDGKQWHETVNHVMIGNKHYFIDDQLLKNMFGYTLTFSLLTIQ